MSQVPAAPQAVVPSFAQPCPSPINCMVTWPFVVLVVVVIVVLVRVVVQRTT